MKMVFRCQPLIDVIFINKNIQKVYDETLQIQWFCGAIFLLRSVGYGYPKFLNFKMVRLNGFDALIVGVLAPVKQTLVITFKN